MAAYGLAMGRLAQGLDPVPARAEVEGPVGAKVEPASSSLHTLQHEGPDWLPVGPLQIKPFRATSEKALTPSRGLHPVPAITFKKN